MTLVNLWANEKSQLPDKTIQQIMAFAGDGQLRDGSEASKEFREFLDVVSSKFLKKYAEQCLQESFNNSGFALQDIVNQIGIRLGFNVTYGRYRGTSGQIGFDGIWKYPDGKVIISEVKTTDAYRINLENIALYRDNLVAEKQIPIKGSSILIIVGRSDTGDLEAQIRGSRHSWDIRLISVDALIRLMLLKEEVDSPEIIRRIHTILIPREYTKLDEIVEIVFSTAEDIRQENADYYEPDIQESSKQNVTSSRTSSTGPYSSFKEIWVERLAKHLNISLIKTSRAQFLSVDKNIALVCAVSQKYTIQGYDSYWFAFHPYQKEFLEGVQQGYYAISCGPEGNLILIPIRSFSTWLDYLNQTIRPDRYYWHVKVFKQNGRWILRPKKGANDIDLTSYLIPN
jgi:hypothetical protein